MINAKVPCSKQLRASNYHLKLIFSFTVHATYCHANVIIYRVKYREKLVIASCYNESRNVEIFFPGTSRFHVGTMLVVASGTRD